MLPQEIIRKKRNQYILSKKDIENFIEGVTKEDISDAQIGALTMAIFLNGFNKEETVNLTLAMRDSGNVLKWDLNGPVVDKHSTGGVGDKVSLLLGPVLAALGAYVPMISGRGLGHTGGTLDKFDSIEGYQTAPSTELFQKTVKEVGCAIIGQTGDLAPADKRIYAVRDVCATVESIPLITASILSKKLAAGLDALVMDIKVGNGAFMEKIEDACTLAQSITEVANNSGTKVKALLTDMNSVLGYNVGNALEVFESVEYLKNNRRNKRLDEVTKSLCTEALLLTGLAKDRKEALQKIEKVISSGAALEKFSEMVYTLGGPIDFIKSPWKYMEKAKIIRPVFSLTEGYVSQMKTRDIGLLIVELKGGRTHPILPIDHATGFSDFCQTGDYLDSKTPICFVHAQTQADFDNVSAKLQKFIKIEKECPKPTDIIKKFF